jgi:hypothetical protein
MIDNLTDALVAYDDMLDDVYSEVTVGERKVSTSLAMRKLTPVEYQFGFASWLESEGYADAADGWDWPPGVFAFM